MIKNILFIISFFFVSVTFAQIEKELPAKPVPQKLVVDYTGTLAPDQQAELESKLVTFDDSTSIQLAVVIIETTGDRDISDYAVALGRAWGIGNKEFNNGILLLVAKNDRKIWIATGYGLEGALPDITTKSIIENEITPNFKGSDFYRGLDEGTNAIISATKGEYKAPENYAKRKRGKSKSPGLIITIIFVIIYLILNNRRGGGGMYNRGGRSGLGTPFFFPIGGSSGFSGGSSSGGSDFGGFGGGSFGGGGSGGSW
jgi:uncharacterized protein